KALEGGVLLGCTRGHRLDGALKIVSDAHHFACEPGDRVLGGLFPFALRALADVFHFGMGPQQLVLKVGALRAQSGNDRLGRLPGGASRRARSPGGRGILPLGGGLRGGAGDVGSRLGAVVWWVGHELIFHVCSPRWRWALPVASRSAGLVLPDIMQGKKKI